MNVQGLLRAGAKGVAIFASAAPAAFGFGWFPPGGPHLSVHVCAALLVPFLYDTVRSAFAASGGLAGSAGPVDAEPEGDGVCAGLVAGFWADDPPLALSWSP